MIGAHYDKTDDAPAAAWDSQEGHAQMIRVAKLMADYWRKGTRPAATVKFIPWDGEESGTLGSEDYAQNVIPPGDEEFKVRGYWNTDPCAGGYPAYRFGNPAEPRAARHPAREPVPRRGHAQRAGRRRARDPGEPAEKYHAAHQRVQREGRGARRAGARRLDDNLSRAVRPQEIFVAPSEARPPSAATSARRRTRA